MKFNIPISRRDFLKIAGITTTGAILNPSLEKVEATEKISGEKIKYAGKEIPILYDVDVCVCGGGPSGTAAAINAAKMAQKLF